MEIKKIVIIFMISCFMLIFVPAIITMSLKSENTFLFSNKGYNLDKIYLYYIEDGKEEKILFEDYIKGVVAAEMPVSFEEEALKAQAVASRTYALKHYLKGEKNYIEDIGQEFLTIKQMNDKWSDNFKKYYDKVSLAVEKTNHEVMFYDEEPIEAVFHSTSAGVTENSKDIWEVELPYLQSVDSSLDENTKGFINNFTFIDEDIKNIFKKEKVNFTEETFMNQFEILEKTDGGYILKVKVADKEFTGGEIRNLLSLKSTNFTVKEKDSEIIFTTKGYGHGAGMSQNGANKMAEQGYNYTDILKHYYIGVEIKVL